MTAGAHGDYEVHSCGDRGKVVHGDCLEFMRGIDSESIDTIITSPPYNLRNSSRKSGPSSIRNRKWERYNVAGYPGTPDNLPYPEYVDMARERMSLPLFQ